MNWLMLLLAVGSFTIGCYSSTMWLLSGGLLSSLVLTLVWARAMALRRYNRPVAALIDPDELKRLES